ncbi:MAG: T9SS type A sorting domain-containing protein [Porphyromonadaceae bacterium]|nr:T9SS type A sorting domain-containing protein [Porphyromonadaceae bacterium]
MKNILLKPMMTLAFTVAMILTGAANMQAQSINMSRYITLTVESGKEIRLNLLAASTDTPIRIVSGSNTQDITVGIDWTGSQTYTTDGNTMTLYGDIIGFICSNNNSKITDVDVSRNTQLTILACSNNEISNLDISQHTQLIKLYCSKNRLTTLDISNNTQLEELYCANNQLTNLDVSNNTVLTGLFCYNNRFTTLDISKNTALIKLYCHNNQITALDLNQNTQLKELFCQNNKLSALDVSRNVQLLQLCCYNLNLSTAGIDSLYCYLPDHAGKSIVGYIYPVYSASSPNHATVMASTKGNATTKNWKVQYFSNYKDIPATSGSFVCPNTNTETIYAPVAVSLYPNPVKDLLHTEADGEVRSIRVYNIYGTEVVSATGTNQIDLSSLPAGVYAVRVVTDKGISVQRVVKR